MATLNKSVRGAAWLSLIALLFGLQSAQKIRAPRIWHLGFDKRSGRRCVSDL